jgi:hypothetical protein
VEVGQQRVAHAAERGAERSVRVRAIDADADGQRVRSGETVEQRIQRWKLAASSGGEVQWVERQQQVPLADRGSGVKGPPKVVLEGERGGGRPDVEHGVSECGRSCILLARPFCVVGLIGGCSASEPAFRLGLYRGMPLTLPVLLLASPAVYLPGLVPMPLGIGKPQSRAIFDAAMADEGRLALRHPGLDDLVAVVEIRGAQPVEGNIRAFVVSTAALGSRRGASTSRQL